MTKNKSQNSPEEFRIVEGDQKRCNNEYVKDSSDNMITLNIPTPPSPESKDNSNNGNQDTE